MFTRQYYALRAEPTPSFPSGVFQEPTRRGGNPHDGLLLRDGRSEPRALLVAISVAIYSSSTSTSFTADGLPHQFPTKYSVDDPVLLVSAASRELFA